MPSDMAFLIIKDSREEYQLRDLPDDMEENGALTVGSDASCDIVLPEGEGFAAVHCKVRWRDGFWALRSVDGMIRVHGLEEQHVKLVEETNYHIGPHTMAFVQDDLDDDDDDDDTGDDEEEEAKEDAKEEGSKETATKGERKVITAMDIKRSRKKRKLARKAGAAKMVSLAGQKKESAGGGLFNTLYVLAVVVAAFIAGLTLRYFLMTGHYLPDKW